MEKILQCSLFSGSSNTPSIQLLSSVRLSQDPRSAPLLVCLLTGLTSPQQHILWGLNDMVVTSVRPEQPWKKSKRGYSATSVREVSTADWKLTSSYWCGTMQGGKMYRQKLCSEDWLMTWRPQVQFLQWHLGAPWSRFELTLLKLSIFLMGTVM